MAWISTGHADADRTTSCAIPAGAWSVHYTVAKPAAPPCPSFTDTTFTATGDRPASTPAPNCTATTDFATCTTTNTCFVGPDLYVSKYKNDFPLDEATAVRVSGRTEVTVTKDGIVTSCPAIEYTYTKQ